MNSFKLNQLNSQELEGKTANRLHGGVDESKCCCGCHYEGQPGGSSVEANRAANIARGLWSPNCYPFTVDGSQKPATDTTKKED